MHPFHPGYESYFVFSTEDDSRKYLFCIPYVQSHSIFTTTQLQNKNNLVQYFESIKSV